MAAISRIDGSVIVEGDEDLRVLVVNNKDRLFGAILRESDLSGANLCGADLRGTDLCGANLCGADLYESELCGANLSGADLCGANLCGADLRGTDLCGADLCGANLCGADLRGADLSGANLDGITGFWRCHNLTAEVLFRAAGDSIPRRMLAGLVLVSQDWCWDKFLSIDHPEKGWALDVLASFGAGDEEAPDAVKDRPAWKTVGRGEETDRAARG